MDLLLSLGGGFLLGILASAIAWLTTEYGTRPSLDIVVDRSRAQGQSQGNPPHEFYHVRVRNVPAIRPLPGRRPAWACRATINVFRMDGSRAITGDIIARWTSQPEPLLPVVAQGQVENVLDPARVMQARRMDVHGHSEEPISVALKFEGDPDCYIFTNESYLFPRWQNPSWRIPPGRYRVRFTVYYERGRVEKDFELSNEGTRRDDVHLNPWLRALDLARGAVMETNNATPTAPQSVCAEDKRLDRLLDYTKFHVGIYLSVGGGLVALIGSASKAEHKTFLQGFIGSPGALALALVFLIFAGFAGGIIASCCTQYRTFEELWNHRQGPHKTKLFTGQTWALLEHGFFWLSVLFFVYAVVSAPAVKKWVFAAVELKPLQQEHRYGAIIDAGSSGSRLAIFWWRITGDGGPHVGQIAWVEDKEVHESECPLTDFLTTNTTCDCLVKLSHRGREKAVRYLGEPNLPRIPLWVKATAGVRKVGEQDKTKETQILGSAEACLSKAAGYEWRGAEVITGEHEGVYAWLAVNQVAGTLRTDAVAATYGIVELGGQSAQIAFRISSPSPSTAMPTRGKVISINIGSKELHIYSISDPLGRKAAEDELGKPDISKNGCALDGSPKRCVSKINDFLCPQAPAGKNCQNLRPEMTPPSTMHFAGLSNFAHVGRNMGLGDATLEDIRERAKAICGSGNKSDIRDAVFKPAGKYRDGVCFLAFYATQLANFGWNLPLEKVYPPHAGDASWPLGAMIFEAARNLASGLEIESGQETKGSA